MSINLNLLIFKQLEPMKENLISSTILSARKAFVDMSEVNLRTFFKSQNGQRKKQSTQKLKH